MKEVPENLENLIAKYLGNQASMNEIDELTEWIRQDENEKIFEEYAEINYAVEYNMTQFDLDKAKEKLFRKIKRDKNIFYRKKFQNILKYAAVLLIIVGAGYFYQEYSFNSDLPTRVIPKEGSITLELENGMIEVINTQSSKEITDSQGNIVGNQKNDLLTYNLNENKEVLVYNTLKVPYGKRFEIQLSDGTKVFLDAGTSLKYPVSFIRNHPREVFLNGEAYFDVSEDKDQPFRVNVGALNIEVLGTEFNVQAYTEDQSFDVILVEGSVKLYQNLEDKNKMTIFPGERGVFNRKEKTITVDEVNTTVYTAWRKGELVFRNMTFNNIIKKLERHFNVVIINQNKLLSEQVFNASFNNDSIESVLSYFEDISDLQYEFKDNIIYIK